MEPEAKRRRKNWSSVVRTEMFLPKTMVPQQNPFVFNTVANFFLGNVFFQKLCCVLQGVTPLCCITITIQSMEIKLFKSLLNMVFHMSIVAFVRAVKFQEKVTTILDSSTEALKCLNGVGGVFGAGKKKKKKNM